MSRSLIPPRYVYGPSALIYSDLPRSVIVTGLRIWGLGWRYQYERTSPIPLQALCEITGLNRSQLYEHLARLVATGVLRYTNISGQFTFLFNRDKPDRVDARASPENRTERPVVVVVDSSSPEMVLDSVSEQQQQPTQYSRGGCGGGAGASGKPDERSEILDRMGILEPTRSELLGLTHCTCEYLEAWEEWWLANDVGIGLVIEQLRSELLAPDPLRQNRENRERYLDSWGIQY